MIASFKNTSVDAAFFNSGPVLGVSEII